MAWRPRRLLLKQKSGTTGASQLTLAYLIITAEKIFAIFARPLILAVLFLGLAWFNFLPQLYPWAHLIALILFAMFFFQSVGKARQHWQPVSASSVKRRVEEASGLRHRPLDVAEDRPLNPGDDQLKLWSEHAEHARQQSRRLRWPKWKLSLADQDPYALRYGLVILVAVALVFGWGALGSRIVAAINPALGKLHFAAPTLDAWITPPEYTHIAPIMIATPAGARHDRDVIDVPEGSVISAHVAEKEGQTPDLIVNGGKVAFDAEDRQDFAIEQEVRSGSKIAIRRGWQDLASWRVHVVEDQPPQISLTEPPSVTERKSVRLAYSASDDFGVTSIVAHITPRESMPGISNDPVDVVLASPDAKDVSRVSFEDLTSHPWAGSPVQIQLIASDAAGHTTATEPVDFTLPERVFTQPVARALIEERKKLLQNPDDTTVRTETANIMAGVAHQPAAYRGDPVVMMALRTGAVRLILDHADGTLEAVANLIWESAVRIEDGAAGLAEQNLHKAQQALSDALDHNASEDEIQRRISGLQQALRQYLSELATHMAARPGPIDDLSQILGPQTNMLTPKDLDHMLDSMRNLSAAGSRDAARQQLAQLQQLLENLHTGKPQWTEEQKQAMHNLLELRDLAKRQQNLLDRTFQNMQAQNTKGNNQAANAKLASEQNALWHQLQSLMHGQNGQAAQSLGRGAQDMEQAGSQLQQGMSQGAVRSQSDAVKALQAALQNMADDLRSNMMMLPMPGMNAMGEHEDPFGRYMGPRDDGSVKVPDQMEVRRVREILDELQRRSGDIDRPKVERDYIDRLLQNF